MKTFTKGQCVWVQVLDSEKWIWVPGVYNYFEPRYMVPHVVILGNGQAQAFIDESIMSEADYAKMALVA